MSIHLEGGCFVSELREGEPSSNEKSRVWHRVGRDSGAQAISLRVLEFDPGLSEGYSNRECDEVLYVFAGAGEIFLNGHGYKVAEGSGIYVAPGWTVTVRNPGPGPLVLVSSQCPEPASDPVPSRPLIDSAGHASPLVSPVVMFDARETVPTRDRWYRVLVDEDAGCSQVTQFVGSIPPGRAPDHFHEYEEVLVMLRGEGTMWAGSSSTPVGIGSCVFLPRGQMHCVENTGTDELRLLGIFYPAGSPGPRNAA